MVSSPLKSSFNSRTREGCDSPPSGARPPSRGFNSRTRKGCDRSWRKPSRRRVCFNSRTHEGCDPMVRKEQPREMVFQFTHPRGVRPDHGLDVRGAEGVSIHAPTRGATWTSHGPSGHALFQFTHPRGVRPQVADRVREQWLFQFTHPRGVRRHHALCPLGECTVSIHAPARGATRSPRSDSRHRGSFNSRTREGCDCRCGEAAVGLPLQTCFCEGTQITPSARFFWHLNSCNRMSMSACECLANS